MSTVTELFKFIVACIPFALILLLVKKVNLKKADRGRQALMPVLALLYSALIIVLLIWLGSDPFDLETRINEAAAWVVRKVPSLVPSQMPVTEDEQLAALLAEQESVARAWLLMFAVTIKKYLIFITNAAFVLIFLVLKSICLPIFSKIWGSNPGLMEGTAGLCYEYDQEYQRWFLQERWRDGRKLFSAFCLASFLMAVILLAMSQQFSSWPVFQALPYPCFACLMLGEVTFLMGGYTRSEYEEDILGDDAESRRIINLTKLREILKQLFGDRLLLESTELESAGKEGVTDLLEELAAGEKHTDRITAEYFEILKADGAKLDVDNILTARSLLEGKSVLFCNPFYKDLTQYFLLPMTDKLMHRRKCLVIAGRKSTEPEIRRWMEEALREHLKMSGLWRVGSVAEDDWDYEIGILSFSQLYDLEMLSERREFFHQVGFVLVLEPSLILATGQVGLSLVVNYCDEEGDTPTYCMCDRNCDGLVDTLSHMIKQSITIVTATETPTCLHSEMCWHSDGEYLHQRIMPDISRYLGVGTELAVAAVKDQVPRVVWRSEKKFPVVDMKWIAGQYYRSICQYANLPMNQESVYSAIGFEADLWGTPKESKACIIVEDEFCNLLEMVRLFLTRAEEEAFVNVISEDYLLRGYMQDNYRIFAADQKAIPTIVPDYARTERNATMRLMMMLMMSESIPEELVEKELRLVGIKSDDLCETLNNLINKYTLETRPVVIPEVRDHITGFELESGVERRMRIRDKVEFIEHAGLSFQTAYYITEDDKENSSYMDAKLFGHIYQSILPGQFFTYDGKFYEVRSVTPEKGVLVRRAADHIVGRRYYRQQRAYHLESRDEDSGRTRLINGLEVTTCGYDISVETDGYLEMDASNDLRRARQIRIADNEAQGNEHFEYVRNYRHKNVLRIRLPETSEEVRYTLCLLLMEVFRTVYADAWHYLAAVTRQTERTRDALRGILYTVDGAGDESRGTALVEDDCIYIIEDSDVDMGLLESVDRNLSRLLGIITDFLDWHTQRMTTPDPEEPESVDVVLPPEEKHGLWWRIKNFFKKILDFFKRLLHIKSDPDKERKKAERKAERERRKAERKAERERRKAEGNAAQEPAAEEVPAEEVPEELPAEETPAEEVPAEEIPAEEVPAEGKPQDVNADDKNFFASVNAECHFAQEAPADDIGGEDEEVVSHQVTNRYQKSCYLLFGYDAIDGHIAVEDTLAYLIGLGFGSNELSHTRKGTEVDKSAGDAEEQCDFCGLPLSGVAYDVLGDGRVRCVTCTASAIQTVDEFRALYKRVLPTMESFFDIRLGMPVRVRTTDARVIAKRTGSVFKPTSGFDARVVGFAQMDKDGFSLYIENGAPRLAAMETIAHELTHIWQYANWDQKGKSRQYGAGANRDMVYEGMAMWASIQFLYLIGEGAYAQRKEAITLQRDDVYGEGFRYYCQKYPLSRGTALPEKTPFHTEPPL